MYYALFRADLESRIFLLVFEIIRESGEYEIILEPRIEKWQDVTGAWHQRWRNRQKLIKWKSSLGAIVF